VAGLFVRVLASVFQEGLVGAGDTLPPMIIGLIGLWAVTIPLAYFLPQIGNLNVYGIRWALVGGQVFATVAVFIYFQTGKWKSKKV
jgi:Na+-driven multidrug efflux pump